MVGELSLSEEEHGRAMQMAADLLRVLSARVSFLDGRLAVATSAKPIDRGELVLDSFDAEFVIDLATRIGEGGMRTALEQHAPPYARAAIEAKIKNEGGVLPLLKNRVSRLKRGSEPSIAVRTYSADDGGFGCALGAGATVAGVAVNGVLGGFTAVVGIVAMAAWC
jgi:hypothetical protein